MIVQYSRILFAGILLVNLAACGPAKTPDVSKYVISGKLQTANRIPARTSKTILVANPIASPGYDTNKMIYVQVPYKLRAFANNQWIAPPAQMLLPMVAQSIRNTGYFKAVVTPPFTGTTTYILSLNLLTLQQEFYQPTSEVRLIIQATLTRATTGQVIASRRFIAIVPAPENNPYSGVIASNQAAAKLSRDIAIFIRSRI